MCVYYALIHNHRTPPKTPSSPPPPSPRQLQIHKRLYRSRLLLQQLVASMPEALHTLPPPPTTTYNPAWLFESLAGALLMGHLVPGAVDFSTTTHQRSQRKLGQSMTQALVEWLDGVAGGGKVVEGMSRVRGLQLSACVRRILVQRCTMVCTFWGLYGGGGGVGCWWWMVYCV